MPIIYVGKVRRSYGPLHFLLDLSLIFLTGGLWMIWIIIRYMKNH